MKFAADLTLDQRRVFTTISGTPVRQVYTADDLRRSTTRETSPTRAVPYTRGIHPHVSRQALDDAPVRGLRHARRDERSASITCSRKGSTGLTVAFDLPTLMGHDPDHALVARRSGQVRRRVASLADMETLFDGFRSARSRRR